MKDIETGRIPTTEQLLDQLAILDVLNMHSRGLDRQDIDCLKSAYWPEAQVDYGAFKGAAMDFADLVLPVLAGVYELTQHKLGNTSIRLDGQRAKSETYVTARHLFLGAEEEMTFVGRYLDTLERRGDQWKLMQRQVVIDWSRLVPVLDERGSESFAEMASGAHMAGDPLYPFLSANQ